MILTLVAIVIGMVTIAQPVADRSLSATEEGRSRGAMFQKVCSSKRSWQPVPGRDAATLRSKDLRTNTDLVGTKVAD